MGVWPYVRAQRIPEHEEHQAHREASGPIGHLVRSYTGVLRADKAGVALSARR